MHETYHKEDHNEIKSELLKKYKDKYIEEDNPMAVHAFSFAADLFFQLGFKVGQTDSQVKMQESLGLDDVDAGYIFLDSEEIPMLGHLEE